MKSYGNRESKMPNTYEQRRTLHEHLKQLVKSEYEQVFRILKKNNEPYTENSNGIFFDIMAITQPTLIEMFHYMEFCIENRRQEQARVSEMASLTTVVNTLLHDSVVA